MTASGSVSRDLPAADVADKQATHSGEASTMAFVDFLQC